MPETMQPHILVVDDDAQIRALLQEYLTENGLRVSVVAGDPTRPIVLGATPIRRISPVADKVAWPTD